MELFNPLTPAVLAVGEVALDHPYKPKASAEEPFVLRTVSSGPAIEPVSVVVALLVFTVPSVR